VAEKASLSKLEVNKTFQEKNDLWRPDIRIGVEITKTYS
jgi:hypothetical protein